MKHAALVTTALALLAFAACNKPTTAQAAPTDDKAAARKDSPTANEEPTPVSILKKEMLALADQSEALGGAADKMMEGGQHALSAVYGGVNLAATTMQLEMKALFMQETVSGLLTDKKARGATALFMSNSYSTMCKQIDANCKYLETCVFNLKRMNQTDDAKRVEDTLIKKLQYLKTEFFIKRRDELNALAELPK